jgi:hypothetical protein
VGAYPATKPEQAAQVVLEWINTKADPNGEKATDRVTAKLLSNTSEKRILRYYLNEVYLPYMMRSWEPGNARENFKRIDTGFKFLLDRDMTTIGKLDIDDWQIKAESNGRAYSTIGRIFGAFASMLRHAVKDGYIETYPLQNYKLLEPSIKDQQAMLEDPEKAKRRMLTPEEIQGVLKGL